MFQRSGIGVIIPKCFKDLVTKSVFVMEYVEGFKVTDTAKLDVRNFPHGYKRWSWEAVTGF